jgi:tetratricopeptide (TPR) repeat protein
VIVVIAIGGIGLLASVSPGEGPPVARATPTRVPTSASDYLAAGDGAFDRKDYAGAIGDYSQAIALNPDDAEAYNNRAYTYMTTQNYAAALADLNEAIQLRPNYPNALMNRGDIYNYYYQVDYDKAITDYERVLAIDPQAATTTSLCGHLLVARNKGMSPSLFLRAVVLHQGVNCGNTSSG